MRESCIISLREVRRIDAEHSCFKKSAVFGATSNLCLRISECALFELRLI